MYRSAPKLRPYLYTETDPRQDRYKHANIEKNMKQIQLVNFQIFFFFHCIVYNLKNFLWWSLVLLNCASEGFFLHRVFKITNFKFYKIDEKINFCILHFTRQKKSLLQEIVPLFSPLWRLNFWYKLPLPKNCWFSSGSSFTKRLYIQFPGDICEWNWTVLILLCSLYRSRYSTARNALTGKRRP